MSVSKRILANLPALRRFSRALFGSQVTGDAQVERVLHVLLDHPERINDTMDLRVILYRHLLKFAAGEVAENGSTQRLDRLVQRRLADLAPQHRVAFLLRWRDYRLRPSPRSWTALKKLSTSCWCAARRKSRKDWLPTF